MGILIRSTKEVFITPTLPSSFPYIKVINGSLFIRVNDHRTPYTSLENYISVMESYGVVVRTTEELSSALGVSLVEVEDNLYLLNGKLFSIYSLSTLLSALGVRIGTVNTQRKTMLYTTICLEITFQKVNFLLKEGVE